MPQEHNISAQTNKMSLNMKKMNVIKSKPVMVQYITAYQILQY